MLFPRLLLATTRRAFSTRAPERTRILTKMPLWSASCISAVSADTQMSILVECEAWSYMFNCGEGTTRSMHQIRGGYRKLRGIFVTGVDSERSSGLPGVLLQSAEAHTPSLEVFGPAGLEHYIASHRSYMVRDAMRIKTHEIQEEMTTPVYSDHLLEVFAVPAHPDDDSAPSKRKRPSANGTFSPNKRVRLDSSSEGWNIIQKHSESANDLDDDATLRRHIVENMFPGRSTSGKKTESEDRGPRWKDLVLKPLPRFERRQTVLSYILLGVQGRGKFFNDKAEALGLVGRSSGNLKKSLSQGKSVTAPDGNVITPDMVMGPPPPRQGMIIVDCPLPSYIPSLIGSEMWKSYQKGGSAKLHCIFHQVGPGVLGDARYREWLETFGPDIHHLYTGLDVSPDRIRHTSVAYSQLRLSHLDKDMFQVPKCIQTPRVDCTTLPGHTTILQHSHHISIAPPTGSKIRSGELDPYHPALEKGGDKDPESLLSSKTLECFNSAVCSISEEASTKPAEFKPGDNVSVIPLGTSSAIPTKYRNVSSLLLQWPGGSVMLDCGEGTSGQLRRQFGEETPKVLRDLRCIFISHMHADHHTGLPHLLAKRRKLEPPPSYPVFVIAPPEAIRCLREFQDLEDVGFDDPATGIRTIVSDHIRRPNKHDKGHLTFPVLQSAEDSRKVLWDLMSLLNLSEVYTNRAIHRGFCHSLILKHRDKWSVVYSGDTRPSDTLAEAGRDATLLIHEATFADNQKEAAVQKRHSTIGEAIHIAKQMRAKNVLLTHFSGRYPKAVQLTSGNEGQESPVIGIAFDHAVIPIKDLWKLNRYLPAIEQSFADSDEDDDVVDPGIME